FGIKGGKAGAFAVSNALKIVKMSNNLGDAKSLITHPATTTHQSMSEEARAELGIDSGLLRRSVGLEDPDDLVRDLTQALDRALCVRAFGQDIAPPCPAGGPSACHRPSGGSRRETTLSRKAAWRQAGAWTRPRRRKRRQSRRPASETRPGPGTWR